MRITTVGKMANYISYATSLFQDKNLEVVVLKAMGKAINKTVTAGERIRRPRGRRMDDAKTPQRAAQHVGLPYQRSTRRTAGIPLGMDRASMG